MTLYGRHSKPGSNPPPFPPQIQRVRYFWQRCCFFGSSNSLKQAALTQFSSLPSSFPPSTSRNGTAHTQRLLVYVNENDVVLRVRSVEYNMNDYYSAFVRFDIVNETLLNFIRYKSRATFFLLSSPFATFRSCRSAVCHWRAERALRKKTFRVESY